MSENLRVGIFLTHTSVESVLCLNRKQNVTVTLVLDITDETRETDLGECAALVATVGM